MDPNDAARDLYERYPYPGVNEDLYGLIAGTQLPSWNPRDSFSVYFWDQEPRDDLEVLIAGCGTNIAQQHAAYLPRMRFVAIDIADKPLAHARKVAERYSLKNIEFHKLPIERVGELGRTFDFVSCTGVLHHLEDPVAGLRALASVTRPHGALSIMLYAKYGRTGIYMLQELFRDRLGGAVSDQDIARVQAALTTLPDDHPFRIVHKDRGQRISFEEIADMLLHPRDRAYTVPDVKDLVERAGMRFQRWHAQAHYAYEVSPLAGLWISRFDAMDSWERAAAMELFYGTLIMHEFVVSHPERKTPDELLAGDRLSHAIPSLSAHLVVTREGDRVVLTNRRHQVPLKVALPIANEFALLKRVDAVKSVKEIVALARGERDCALSEDEAVGLFRRLYLADMIDLRSATSARSRARD